MSILSVSTLPGLSSYCQVIVADEERSSSLYIARPRTCYIRTRTGSYLANLPNDPYTLPPVLYAITTIPSVIRLHSSLHPAILKLRGEVDKRKQEAERIRNKYNDRIPVSFSRVEFRVDCRQLVHKIGSMGMHANQFYHFHAPLPNSRLSLVNSAELIYRNLFCTDCQSSTLVASRACSHFGSIIDSHQVICEKVEKSDISDIDKKKYLVPAVSPLYSAAPTPLPPAERRSYRSCLVCCVLVVLSSMLDPSSNRT
jgi:hypothetical protein